MSSISIPKPNRSAWQCDVQPQNRSVKVRCGVTRYVSLDALDFTALVRPGERIVCGQGTAEPIALTGRLIAQAGQLGDLELFLGAVFTDTFAPARAGKLRFSSYGALGRARALSAAGRLDIVPSHYSALAQAFASGAEQADVVLLQLSPAIAGRGPSLSLANDYVALAARRARLVTAEMSETGAVDARGGAPVRPSHRYHRRSERSAGRSASFAAGRDRAPHRIARRRTYPGLRHPPDRRRHDSGRDCVGPRRPPRSRHPFRPDRRPHPRPHRSRHRHQRVQATGCRRHRLRAAVRNPAPQRLCARQSRHSPRTARLYPQPVGACRLRTFRRDRVSRRGRPQRAGQQRGRGRALCGRGWRAARFHARRQCVARRPGDHRPAGDCGRGAEEPHRGQCRDRNHASQRCRRDRHGMGRRRAAQLLPRRARPPHDRHRRTGVPRRTLTRCQADFALGELIRALKMTGELSFIFLDLTLFRRAGLEVVPRPAGMREHGSAFCHPRWRRHAARDAS